MSAYVCNPAQFGLLAAAAVLRRNVITAWQAKDEEATARQIAERLALENIRSVEARYPDTKNGQKPGPNTADEITVKLAGDWGAYYLYNFPAVSDVALLKLCGNYAYQSCETNDWRDTLAYQQIEWIKDDLIRRLPGYDEAPWGWDVEAMSPPAVKQVSLAKLARKG